MTQLELQLNLENNYLERDFIVISGNRHAHQIVTCEMKKIFLIFGEKLSGKTHLGYIWKARNQDAQLIDGIDDFAGDAIQEELLFYRISKAIESRESLMLTSRNHPNNINFQLKDLASRIAAIERIKIAPPLQQDIALLLAQRLFASNVMMSGRKIAFLAKALPRSFLAINKATAMILDLKKDPKNLSFAVLRDLCDSVSG